MSNWMNIWDIDAESDAYMSFIIGIENFIFFKNASCIEDLPAKARRELTGLFMMSLKNPEIDWLIDEPECTVITHLTGKFLEKNEGDEWAKEMAKIVSEIAMKKCKEQINYYFDVMQINGMKKIA
jgi:hypothetical protein